MLERISSSSISHKTSTTGTPDGASELKEETVVIKREQTKEKLSDNEKEKVAKVVGSLNDFLKPTHTSLKFEFHEKLNEYYVTLVNDTTNEVVKEIPSKKMLDFYAAMEEFIGIMIDKKI